MARILYALSGQGRGHTSRVMAISSALRVRGHELCFICGGTARAILEEQGEPIIPVPALRHEVEANRLRLWKTLKANWKHVVLMPWHVRRLAERMAAFEPDLLITDFEVYSVRAARKLGVPVLSLNHQQVVTETTYQLPKQYRHGSLLTGVVINAIAPSKSSHTILTSFFFLPLKNPETTTLVPPIIRPEVQNLTVRQGEHVLVYLNDSAGVEHVLEALEEVDADFILYNVPDPGRSADYPNLTFKEPSLGSFLEDLASCKALVSTAGYTLISEALYLGKPMLVMPNRGIFEQTINALFLEREGLGEAVIDRDLTATDVTTFLGRLSSYEHRLRGRVTIGNEEAVSCIERVLEEVRGLEATALSHPI